MKKFTIWAEYPDGTQTDVCECESLDVAHGTIIILESMEENYNVIYEIR